MFDYIRSHAHLFDLCSEEPVKQCNDHDTESCGEQTGMWDITQADKHIILHNADRLICLSHNPHIDGVESKLCQDLQAKIGGIPSAV